jgi:hypothetical protein
MDVPLFYIEGQPRFVIPESVADGYPESRKLSNKQNENRSAQCNA